MAGEYRVSKCEDTGKPALYCKVKSYWVLIAHEPDFRAIAEQLAKAVVCKDAEEFLEKHKITRLES